MLNLNCILADIVNKIRITNKYGTCTDKWDELLCYISSYQWLYNNAWDCLTDCQKKSIEVFIKTYFNNYSYSVCEEASTNCTDIEQYPNDNCSGAYSIGYITSDIVQVSLSDQSNTYVCGEWSYPTDSGISLPDSWDVSSSGDVWFKFSTFSNSVLLSPYITVSNGTIIDPQIAVYKGPSCAGLTFVGDAPNGTSSSNWMQPTLNAGVDYFIRIANGGGNSNTGTFDLTISYFPIL